MALLTFIEKIVRLIKRPKTLNTLLYSNLTLIVTQLTVSGDDISKYLDTLSLKPVVLILLKILVVMIFGEADYIAVGVLMITFILLVYLKSSELRGNSKAKISNKTVIKDSPKSNVFNVNDTDGDVNIKVK